jgi:hypothetical protein
LEWDINWKLDLDLEAVKNGGLQILSTFDGPNLTPKKTSTDGLYGYKDYIEKAIQAAFSNMNDLRKALAEDLAGQQGLCLPAGGVFFFKNPVLSHRSDLVCSISYNNTPAADYFDPDTDTVLNEDGKDRLEIEAGHR